VVNVSNALVFFLSCYNFLKTNKESETTVFGLTVVMVVMHYIKHVSCNPDQFKSKMQCFSDLSVFSFLGGIIAFLSPVLRSLTVDVADDTLILWTVILFCVHLLSHDYQQIPQIQAQSGSPISFNSIFLASVLLSSRMEHMPSSFVLLFQSLMIFGGGPYFRGHLRSHDRTTYEKYSIISTLQLALFVLMSVGIAGAIYYSLLVLFLMIGGPILFIYAYSFKNDIRGPWDIPTVKDYKAL